MDTDLRVGDLWMLIASTTKCRMGRCHNACSSLTCFHISIYRDGTTADLTLWLMSWLLPCCGLASLLHSFVSNMTVIVVYDGIFPLERCMRSGERAQINCKLLKVKRLYSGGTNQPWLFWPMPLHFTEYRWDSRPMIQMVPLR